MITYCFIHKNSSYSFLVAISSFFLHYLLHFSSCAVIYLLCLVTSPCLFKLSSWASFFQESFSFSFFALQFCKILSEVLHNSIPHDKESLIYNRTITSSIFFFLLSIMHRSITFALSAQLHRLMLPKILTPQASSSTWLEWIFTLK